MKSKILFLAGLLFMLSSFTTRASFKTTVKQTTDVFEVGGFTVSGQTYVAWGDGAGHISNVYVESTGLPVYSASGTYTADHYAQIVFEPTSTSGTLTFNGYCYY